MTSAEFRSAVSLGLGRAVLNVNRRSHSDALIDACLHSKAHDPQVEGTRTRYTMQLIERSGKRDYYAKKIIASVGEVAEYWDASHRFALARQLAASGDVRARKAMAAAFERAEWDLMERAFAIEWLGLDGLDGYLYAIEHIGRRMRDGCGNYLDGWLQWKAEQQLGAETVWSAMLANASENVAAYLKAVEVDRQHLERPEYPQDSGFDGDVAGAAAELARETEIDRLRGLLSVFRRRPFPGDCAPLLALASSPITDIRRRAQWALGNVTSDRVRDFAIALLNGTGDRRGYAVRMFASNFREGDHEYLLHWVEREPDSSNFDRRPLEFQEIFQKHPNEAVERRIFAVLYERIPCGHCRRNVVERMLQMGSLSPELRAECAWDSYEETRALVA